MNDLITVNENSLVVFNDQELNAVDLFEKKEVVKIVETVKTVLSKEVFDVSEETGRKDLQKRYKQIRKWSKLLDDVGKTHVAELKARPKIVDGNRKDMRDELEGFADTVRKPLTEWEQAEEKRKQDILARVEAMNLPNDHEFTTSAQFKEFLAGVNAVVIDSSFMEFEGWAKETKEKSTLMLEGMIARKQKEEQEAAEAERLRLEAEEKARAEREKRIAEEAAEKARKEAETKAEQERKVAELKAEAERQELIRKEREAKEAQERAEREKIAAEERAKLEQEQAIKAEQERHRKELEARKVKEEAERKAAEKKAENKRHRAKINNQIVKALMDATLEEPLTESQAKLLVTLIAKNLIPCVTIYY